MGVQSAPWQRIQHRWVLQLSHQWTGQKVCKFARMHCTVISLNMLVGNCEHVQLICSNTSSDQHNACRLDDGVCYCLKGRFNCLRFLDKAACRGTSTDNRVCMQLKAVTCDSPLKHTFAPGSFLSNTRAQVMPQSCQRTVKVKQLSFASCKVERNKQRSNE